MQNIIEVIKVLIQDVSGISTEDIETDCNLFSLGLDSLMLVQIKKKMDRKFQIEIPMARVMSDLDTIEKIAYFISEEKTKAQKEIEMEIETMSETKEPNYFLLEENRRKEKEPVNDQEEHKNVKEEEMVCIEHSGRDIQNVFEMQMRVMAESLQTLATKQLEAIGKVKKDEPVRKANQKKGYPEIHFRAIKIERDIFNEQQKQFIQEFIVRYNRKTMKSKEYAQKNRKQFCDWIASLNFRTDFKELIYPIVSARSQGAKFWDLDGNEYLDMAIGYGVHFFGHRPKFILEALQKQLGEGYETGPQTDLGGEVSTLLCKITGVERVAFSNTGSEAVMASLRIARTVNKKAKIVMFKGSYHGNFDCILAESMDNTTFPTSPGTMPGMVEDLLVLEYGKEESLHIIKEHGEEIAGVIVEPVQSRNPGLQPREFLHKLRALTEQIQAALIFDEMITGFRICPGGCQEYFGVQADMVTYGKIVGGGLPIGIVAGKAKYLDAVDGGYWNYGDESYPEKEMTFFAGTFCKHPLSMAASKAVLQFIEQDNGEVQKRVNALTQAFVKQTNAYFQEEKIPMRITYFGSEFRFEAYGKYDFETFSAEMELFFYMLMEKGIYIWEKRTCFFSAAHTVEDAKFFLQAIQKTIQEMRKGGFPFCVKNEKAYDFFSDLSSNETKKKTEAVNCETIEEDVYCNVTKEQERYFLLSQMDKSQEGTHLTSAFLLTGEFETERVTEIFQKIVDSQEALRSSYAIIDQDLRMKIQKHCPIRVEHKDGKEEEINRYIQEFIRPFDLYQAPMMHVKIVKLSEQKYLLLSDVYHGIADGYSCTLITKQFMDLYEGKETIWKSSSGQRYITSQEQYHTSIAYQEDMEYWNKNLGEKDFGIVYPLDYPRKQKQEWNGQAVHQIVEHQTLVGLKKLAKSKKCSLFHILYGAFAMLLYKATKKKEFVIGTPMVNRGEEFLETVGYYTNTVVILNEVEDLWTLEQYLDKTKKNCANSFAHGRVGISELVSSFCNSQACNRNAIFDTMFIYENGEERVSHIADLRCDKLEIPITRSFFDLSMEIVEEHKELDICVTYKTSLYKAETIKRMLGYYKVLLKELLQHPEEKIQFYLRKQAGEWIKGWKEEPITIYTKEPTKQIGSELEDELSEYWKECLHLDYVTIQDNFFELGGRSIDAMQLIDKLKEKYAVSIMDLFHYPSIELLAKKIRGESVKQVSAKKTVAKEAREGQMPIAIIGMAGRFPKSNNKDEFWENLVKEKECIAFLSKEELLAEGISEEEIEQKNYVRAKGVLDSAECFDAAFFEYSPKEAEKMDPQMRVFHECAWNALEDAGYTPGSIAGGRGEPQNIGVFAGSASNYTWMSHIYQPTSMAQERIERISLNDKDYLPTRISYKFDLTGPSYGIQTACSSSLTSIHLACKALEAKECEMALAGGVSIMLPKKTGYCYEEGMIFSKDGHCRVFDNDATGTVFSDGVGVLVLKPLKQAIADKDEIYAVIKGTATNNDGNRKAGYTAPSISGQAKVMKEALARANVEPSTVTFVETHGTGTKIGDPIEVEGLKEVYPRKEKPYCALGTLKANFGHLDAAAGVAGVMKAALALKYHKIPGNIGCENPNEAMHLEESSFYMPHRTIEWVRQKGEDGIEIPRRAGVTSLGFGGTNAHVVLEEAEVEKEILLPDESLPKLFLFSAKTNTALERIRKQYVTFIEEKPEIKLEHIAYTLQIGRKAFPYREMILAKSREELRKALCDEKKHITMKVDIGQNVQVVFLFSGQGSQYVNMAKDLYDKEPLFQEKLNDCFTIMKHNLGIKTDYRNIMFPNQQDEKSRKLLQETKHAQVAIFIMEYAMASYLMELGVIPDACIGHSLGEYALACVAGVFSLEDGLRLVIGRASLMQDMERGGMDALNTSEEKTKELIQESGRELWIASVNGKNSSVVSGSFQELEAFEAYLEQKEIAYRRLETSHAFHSGMMDMMIENFKKLVETIPMSLPQIPYISNLTGTWVQNEVLTPEYWCEHLRQTVRFSDGIQTLLQEKCIFVEVGPGKVLSTLVKQCSSLVNVKTVINMIRHPKEKENDIDYFMKKIGELWCHGINVDFRSHYAEHPLRKISLPGYPFKGQEFRMLQMVGGNENVIQPITEWLYRPCWKFAKKNHEVKKLDVVLLLATDHFIAQSFLKKLKEEGICCNVLMVHEAWETKLHAFVSRNRERKNGVCILNTVPYSEPDMEHCFWDIIRQVQLLGGSQKVDYYVLTKKEESQRYLAGSLIKGVLSVANKEYDNLSCTQLEIEGAEDIKQLSDLVLAQCRREQNETFVKIKNGVPLVQDEEPLKMRNHGECAFCENGNYVITGGMGDIGRHIASYLTEKYHANVLLLARSGLPEEEVWEQYMKEQPYEYTTQKIKSVLQWRQSGASIVVSICDICDEQVLEKEIWKFEKKYGKVNGVFHTAGLKGEGLLRFKTKEKSLEVLEPKVQGTMALDVVFANRNLDFMLLFSSLVTITQEAGQADYIAANRYLDAYAEWASVNYPNRKTISVCWDNWKEIGMAHRAGMEKPSRDRFFASALLPTQGMRLIEKILCVKEPHVIVSVEELRRRKQATKKENQEEIINQVLKGNATYERPELSSEYVEPSSELQKHIAKVWECAFSVKEVGIQDDFFELGGDSLYAIGIVNELKKYYQIDMTDIYNYPTVAQLARKLEDHSVNLEQQLGIVKKAFEVITDITAKEQELREERERYSALCIPYQNLRLTKTKKWKQILLLGGTGYLGIYLLREIIIKTDAKVVLIVRPTKDGDGKSRIYDKLCHFFGEVLYQAYQDRWLILDGEITETNFGLDYSVYWDLATSTECIVNASGKVDHYGEYEAFYEANVETVKQVIAFAKTGCKKEIHQVSTKGVGTGKIEERNCILFTEFDTDFGQEFDNYYVDTKHEAEQLLLKLQSEGFDVNLYRVGNIVYDSGNGHFQENIEKNAVYLLMQAILELDYLPDLPFDYMEFSFVDFVSKAIVALMRQEELRQETYHLLNPFLLSLKDLEEVLEKEGYHTGKVSTDEFLQYLIEHYDDEKKKKGIQNFLTYSHLLDIPKYTEFVIASEKTCCILRNLGLHWTKPDVASLSKMIRYGQKIHFFANPGEKEA